MRADRSANDKVPSSRQTLIRGLDVIEAVAAGATDLATLATRLGTRRSTTHRLAAALVERRFLDFIPREGYSLGPKLLDLGFQTQQAAMVVRLARVHLEKLARAASGETRRNPAQICRYLWLLSDQNMTKYCLS
jgi:DNA-binding IclR family transcriptional regulator